MVESKPRYTRLEDWLAWMETLHPSEIDLGLQRIHTVAERLGVKKAPAKVVTVAGTNGKGSCVATLEKLLLATGQRVGSFTSPHITTYNERVRLNGIDVSDEALCQAFSAIDAARGDISLTYFEFGTLAAFIIFAEAGLDYWLLEVGLGGRLDAVNIISPDIAVVTSIDLDHQAWLGDSRDQIAVEKLGILRTGIPCVCAEKNLTESMEKAFQDFKTPLYLMGQHFSYAELASSLSLVFHQSNGDTGALEIPTPQLPLPSFAAACQVAALLGQLPDKEALNKSVAELRLRGRFQKYATKYADIVLDVAHNPAACALLAKKLNSVSEGRCIGIVGMMKDKQISASLEPLIGHIGQWHVAGFPVARSASVVDLSTNLSQLGVNEENIFSHASISDAVESVVSGAISERETTERPTVVVFGSFYSVSDALSCLPAYDVKG